MVDAQFPSHYLIMVYICTTFLGNILNGSELWSVYNFSVITKGHNTVKIVCGVIVLLFCILSNHGLRMYRV